VLFGVIVHPSKTWWAVSKTQRADLSFRVPPETACPLLLGSSITLEKPTPHHDTINHHHLHHFINCQAFAATAFERPSHFHFSHKTTILHLDDRRSKFEQLPGRHDLPKQAPFASGGSGIMMSQGQLSGGNSLAMMNEFVRAGREYSGSSFHRTQDSVSSSEFSLSVAIAPPALFEDSDQLAVVGPMASALGARGAAEHRARGGISSQASPRRVAASNNRASHLLQPLPQKHVRRSVSFEEPGTARPALRLSLAPEGGILKRRARAEEPCLPTGHPETLPSPRIAASSTASPARPREKEPERPQLNFSVSSPRQLRRRSKSVSRILAEDAINGIDFLTSFASDRPDPRKDRTQATNPPAAAAAPTIAKASLCVSNSHEGGDSPNRPMPSEFSNCVMSCSKARD
jgi:hypothetical protein